MQTKYQQLCQYSQRKFFELREETVIRELILVAMTSLLLAWLLFLATPFDILASNLNEFTNVPSNKLLLNGLCYVLLLSLAIFAIYLSAYFIFTDRLRKTLLCFLIAIALSSWVNSTFLVGVYGEFDGRNNLQISAFGWLSWLQLGGFLALFVLAMSCRNKLKPLNYIVGIVLSIVILTSVINITNRLFTPEPKQTSGESFFKYSKNNVNVLFILLDEYQADYFQHILTPELEQKLKGFIWYDDAAANFPTTIAALPAMFTGDIYRNQIDILDFYRKVSKDSVANQFHKMGAVVNYTSSSPMSEYLFPKNSLVYFPALNDRNLSSYSDLVNYSLFRAAPDLLKPYAFQFGSWLMNLNAYDTLGGIGASFKLLDYIASNQVEAVASPATFKFHHSVVTHNPTAFTADCKPGKVKSTLANKSAEGACAMSRVIKIIDNLKTAGVFDNTLIIVTADHGSVYKIQGMPDDLPYQTAVPTLLIKPLHRNAAFERSNFPAALSDLAKTMAVALNIPHQYPGVNLFGPHLPTERTRVFNYYHWSLAYHDWSKNRVPPITTYAINGPLKDPKSWGEERMRTSIPCGTTVHFTDPEDLKFYFSQGITETASGMAAAKERTAEIQFKVSPECKDPKNITLMLQSTQPHNPTARVLINDQSVGQIDWPADVKEPQSFRFALPSSSNHSYLIQIEAEGTKKNAVLGFNVISMTLTKEGNAR